jgi:hypothetical protein
MGTYVLGQEDRQQPGIRPTPYSTNKAINLSWYNLALQLITDGMKFQP